MESVRDTGGDGAAPLLQAKLRLPVVPAAVARPRLFELLDAALQRRLTLVSAPAGFGKTTLVAGWAASLPARSPAPRVAWLSLDPGDGDLFRFLSYLIAALQRVEAQIGRGLQDALRSPSRPAPEALLTALANELAAVAEGQPQILVILDDYHALEGPQVDEAVGFLLDSLPPTIHLVITSRVDPPLPLARLRARGELAEIRARDLRFTADEARALLAEALRLPLAPAEVQALCERTEGWAAGLQLAGLALRSFDGPPAELVAEFAGSHRYVMDYLADEVLQRQPLEVQRFLLETSPLNRLCAELCDAVRQQGGSQQLLERLERANLFLVPLDERRRWYRYHQLFADLLRHRLRLAEPGAVAGLRRRAALWYASYADETGEPAATVEALDHAEATGDDALAAELLDRFGDRLWEGGDLRQLRRRIDALPPDSLARHPRLIVLRAWLRLTEGELQPAHDDLERARVALGAPPEAEIGGRVAAAGAFIATFQGDLALTQRLAREALSLLSARSPWRGGAAIALGDAYSLGGELAPASDSYAEALAACAGAGNTYLALNAGFKLAATLRQRGMLPEAFELCSQQIAVAERSGLVETDMAGCLYALSGDILCEWDRVAEGLERTRLAVQAAAGGRHVGFAGWIALFRARSLLSARDYAGAADALATVASAGTPPWIATPLAALRALVQAARGDLDGALAWARAGGISPDDQIPPARETEYLVLARLLAAQGRLEAAERLLGRLGDAAGAGGRVALAVTTLVALALIRHSLGRGEEALASLSLALRLAEPGGFVRSFLDAGPALVPLLREAPGGYAARLLEIGAAPAASRSPDALSEREAEVLGLIAAGLKNQEIAAHLVVSLNTVLYHTKNIYGKLGVTHRTQAVQRARELGLLS